MKKARTQLLRMYGIRGKVADTRVSSAT